MSSTLLGLSAPRAAGGDGDDGATRQQATPSGPSHSHLRDGPAIAALAVCFAALTALTWRRWGVPEIDAGAELTTADLVKHGAVAYKDVRYYYGPLGLYSLALAFKLLGTSFTTAYAFGLAQTVAIVAAFYALARQWLDPLPASLASMMVLAIGFSGTAFNFILPHTNSATFGLLFLLLTLLSLARGRLLWAGAMAGLTGLTRPEFYAVTVAALAAFTFATYRFENRTTAIRTTWRLALPAVAVPAVVLGWFAWQAGLNTLITENLWPVKFIAVGAKTQHSWMPLTAASLLGLALRATIYVGVLAAVVKSAERLRASRSASIVALWPLLALATALIVADGLLRASGILSAQRTAIELESRHLMLGMSWLPALGFAVAAVAAVRLLRRGRSPLGGRWPVDLALIVAAAPLGLRAYNAFTTEGSYAPYYAAPLVLLLAIVQMRVAERRPAARPVMIGGLALLAAGFSAYALGGLYVHDNTPVHTPHGTFMTTAAAAPALEGAVRAIDASTNANERILAAPVDGGLYFMSDRRPALYELSLLPGLLASPAEEAAAVARLRREHVTLAVIGARDFSAWGTPTFGVNYAPLLGSYLRGAARRTTTVGTLRQPAAGTNPSRGFTVMRLG